MDGGKNTAITPKTDMKGDMNIPIRGRLNLAYRIKYVMPKDMDTNISKSYKVDVGALPVLIQRSAISEILKRSPSPIKILNNAFNFLLPHTRNKSI